MKEQKILAGDHAVMTDSQRRTHYAGGCRHDDCRAAASIWRNFTRDEKKDAQADPSRRTIFADGWRDGRSRARAAAAEKVADATAPTTRDEAVASEITEVLQEPAPKPTPPPPAGGLTIAAKGAARRLQGLVEMGYGPDHLAQLAGVPSDTIWWLLIEPPTVIGVRFHAHIVKLFKVLRLEPPIVTAETAVGRRALRARALATRHHWAGAFDWNDIDTDGWPIQRTDKNRDHEALAEAIATAKLEEPEAAAQVAAIQATEASEQALAAMTLQVSQFAAERDQARLDLANEQEAHRRDIAARERTEAELRAALKGEQQRLKTLEQQFDETYFEQKREIEELQGAKTRGHAA